MVNYVNQIAIKYPLDVLIFWKHLWPAVAIIILVSIYFYWIKRTRYIAFFWLGPLGANMLAHLFKLLILRPRPYILLPIRPLDIISSHSFPSGHLAFMAGILPIFELKEIRQYLLGKIIY